MNGEIETSPKNEGPKGVGGWLLFFCFALVVLGPPRTIEELSKTWDHLKPGAVFPVVRQLAVLETTVTVLIMIYGMVVGILIWKGSRRGRTLARQYLVIRGTIALLLAAFVVLWGYSSFSVRGAKAMGATMVSSTFLEIGICLIWWTYFTYSKRVRNTYCTSEE